jgi:hypothetical protein
LPGNPFEPARSGMTATRLGFCKPEFLTLTILGFD